MATAVHLENIPIWSEIDMCLKYTLINVNVKSMLVLRLFTCESKCKISVMYLF